ncbi:MAG: Lrp/AsnC family transcriptional regulator [Chloroflexi bacterium]|nr:Lrp/AsnC family transcriptional regulator [Chloroflexota bacterium]
MSIPDSKDQKIVQLLGHDARQDSEAIADQLGLSAATIRRRVKRLLKSGLLRVVGIVDPADFGLPLAAVIAIDADPDKLHSIINILAKQTEIKWVSTTTGRFDIMIFARFPSSAALSDFVAEKLSGIEGIKDTETFMCLDVKKGRHTTMI